MELQFKLLIRKMVKFMINSEKAVKDEENRMIIKNMDFESDFEDKIDKFCADTFWNPKQRDIKWTKKYIAKSKKSGKDIMMWITSSYTLYLKHETKQCRVVEMNAYTPDPYLPTEELGRVAKCLRKLGWTMDTGHLALNTQIQTGFRLVPGLGDISDKNIPMASYK